jgi:hypothetical protein
MAAMILYTSNILQYAQEAEAAATLLNRSSYPLCSANRTFHLVKCGSLEHLHTILRNLNPGADWNRRHASDNLMQRLSSISALTFNVDTLSGVAYPSDTSRFSLEPQLNLSGIKRLEFSIPDGQERGGAGAIWSQSHRLISSQRTIILTTLIIRHSSSALRSLQPLLASVPQLQSLTYDFFYDCKDRAGEIAQMP